MILKLTFYEESELANKQKITAENESGIVATIYEGGDVRYSVPVMTGSTMYYDIQGIRENFSLFAANITKHIN